MEKQYLSFLFLFLNLLIGLFFILNEKNKKIRWHFFTFVSLLSLWTIILFFYSSQIFLSDELLAKIFIIFTIALSLELIFFTFRFQEKPFVILKISLVFAFSLLIFFVFSFKNLFFIANIPFYLSFFVLIFLYAVWLATILIERFLKISEKAHSQIMAILVGFGIFITLVAIFSVFFPIFFGKNFYWLVLILSTFYIVFIGFSINRDYLFERKIILFELLLGLISFSLLALLILTTKTELKILTGIILLLFCFVSFYILKFLNELLKEKDRLKNIMAEWEKLNLAKDQFILSFQHHLRTPLVPIKGYLELILKGAYGREENPLIREKLLEMKKLATDLYSLIEGLLDIQEIKMGKQILNLEDCQINDLVESVIEELTIELESKGLYLNFEKGDLPVIKADRKKIREAIWNLIDNAIKYTNEGKIDVATKIENNNLKIIVSDTGIGMTKEEIDYFLKGKLFERGESAKKLYGPGRGIGLSLSIEFVKAHGGNIFAESAGPGQGTTFWIELPIK